MILRQRLHSPASVHTADFPSTTACRRGRSQLEGSSLLRSQSRPAVSQAPCITTWARNRGTAVLSLAPAAMSPPALRAQMGQAPASEARRFHPASQPVSVGQSHRRRHPARPVATPHSPLQSPVVHGGCRAGTSHPRLRGKGPPGPEANSVCDTLRDHLTTSESRVERPSAWQQPHNRSRAGMERGRV